MGIGLAPGFGDGVEIDLSQPFNFIGAVHSWKIDALAPAALACGAWLVRPLTPARLWV
jgi:hypothetical protein